MQVVQIEKGMGGRNEKRKRNLGVPNKGEEKERGVGNKLKIHIFTLRLQRTNEWCGYLYLLS